MGAWTHYYKRGDRPEPGTPHAFAILAIKKELDFRGFIGMNLTSTSFGQGAHQAVKRFQERNKMTADGVVGPKTARLLARKRVREIEEQYGIPESYLCKMKSLESANDFGATGFLDPGDRGLYQISLRWHPEVRDEMAFDPEFAGVWSGNALSNAFKKFDDWDVALAAHNVGGGGAAAWLKAGKPADTKAAAYVRILKAQPC